MENQKPKNPAIKIYTPTESQIAIAFVEYVDIKHPHLSKNLIKIDNENKCTWAEGKRKKRMGKRKGASDYFFAKPQDTYNGLWLEIKSTKGKESPEQKEFGERVSSNGYAYACCYGLIETIEAFEKYIK